MNTISKSLLSDIIKLRQKKYRDLQQRYIISGLNAVQTALQADDCRVHSLLVQQGRQELLRVLNIKKEKPVYQLSENDFRKISEENSPQGIAVVLERPLNLIEDFHTHKGSVLYLENINDPGNLGTIIRSALWFGSDSILLSPGSVDPYQPKVVRASAGLVTHTKLYENVTSAELSKLKLERGFQIAGTVVLDGQPVEKYKVSDSVPLVLAFGSEAHGLSEEIQEICDHKITITKKGTGESLNLGISAALCLFSLNQVK